jgi:hypothetical protein
MSIINKPPEMVKREYELQEPIAAAVEKYATFIESTPDHVVKFRAENGHLERRGVPALAQATADLARKERWPHRSENGARMMQRILHTRHFLACLLAAAMGMALFFRAPFPEGNLFLRIMAVRSTAAYLFFKYSYTVFLYTTPYIAFSIMLSGLYIFALKADRKIRARRLPLYPDPRTRTELSLVLGEVHDPRKSVPSETPRWLALPERGLFTGIAIVGAVGSGKTASCMYPFAEQILAYRAADPDRRIGGLILEVKGDFCARVREILARYGRAEDYVEISLESEYRYNPLHNDLDAYALAYNIASLLNNLFGRGKEPFWQQAYTNLAKFIILLHKVAFDYVTLFDVYECAINPDLLERPNQGSPAPADRVRLRPALGRRVSEVSARPRTVPVPAG